MSQTDTDALSFLASEQIRLLRAGIVWLFAYVLIYSAGFSVIDIYASEESPWYLVFGIFTWLFGYKLLVGLMQKGGYLSNNSLSGLGVYFGLSLMVGIGALIGAVLFLLPGVYLALRWQASYPFAIATGAGVGDAMKWSWQKSAAFQRPLFTTFLPPLLFYCAAFAAFMLYDFNYESVTDAGYALITIGLNLFTAIGFAWFTLLSVAVYGLLSNRMSDVTQTFE
uniref:hypothetical protein n=1 Tax=uncultured Erythrobacter sp. TaxID=263913 RepID=UPI00260EBE39|nr:hypothetical protein [uncultured Erythrobacter sp.]